jgi:hypothetical protein
VRVVSSSPGPGNSDHPILNDDPHGANSATSGQPVDAIFSQAELDEMERKYNDRNKYLGNWK